MIDGKGLKDYTGGIWDGSYKDSNKASVTCSNKQEDLNTVLLLVGVGVDKDGKEFYIAQNSWGTIWGENGYIRFERKFNFCGMSICASYPKINAF